MKNSDIQVCKVFSREYNAEVYTRDITLTTEDEKNLEQRKPIILSQSPHLRNL